MSKVKINSKAPDFTLQDYQGNVISLAQFKGKQHVLLVFNRGFTWPFCRAHMAQLRRDIDEFADRNVAIVVIGPENADKFAAYFSKHRLPFVGLPDPKHQVLKRYGQEIKLFKLGRMPAQVFIDKDGIARYVHYGNSMSDIPSNQELLSQIDEITLPKRALKTESALTSG